MFPGRVQETEAFLAVATSQSLLATDVAALAAREAGARGIPPAQVVLEKGLMDVVQVDIVQTLLDPTSAIPGYEMLSVLGRGGMGVVYKARQQALDRVVAVKTVLVTQLAFAGAAARFEKEARTVAGLRHPNIVQAHDFGKHSGRLFLVMELLEGETLEGLITRRGALPETLAWGLARQTAAGLAEAARQGIVHRDIKPANLFLVDPPLGSVLPAGMPLLKITDFGLVLCASDGATDVRLTAAGTSLGTPLYMAPEQFSTSEVDHRADIYSLGATVYYLLSAQPAFAGKKFAEIVVAKTRGELPPLGGLSPASAELLTAMMACEPEKRLGDYAKLLERIDHLLSAKITWSATPTQLVPTGAVTKEKYATQRVGEPGAKRRTWMYAALGIALIAIGAAAFFFWPRSQPAPTLVSSGRALPLFNGVAVSPPDWILRQGEWKPASDVEGGAVLSGKGMVQRRLPPWSNYRIAMGLDLRKAAAVELQFAFAPTGTDPARLVLRVTPEGALLARRTGDDAALISLGATVPLPARSDDDGPVYTELRVERHETVWRAYFAGKQIGTAPAGEELAEFRLMTEGGPAFFETMEVSELVRGEQ